MQAACACRFWGVDDVSITEVLLQIDLLLGNLLPNGQGQVNFALARDACIVY